MTTEGLEETRAVANEAGAFRKALAKFCHLPLGFVFHGGFVLHGGNAAEPTLGKVTRRGQCTKLRKEKTKS
jgi:hypothetical protein